MEADKPKAQVSKDPSSGIDVASAKPSQVQNAEVLRIDAPKGGDKPAIPSTNPSGRPPVK